MDKFERIFGELNSILMYLSLIVLVLITTYITIFQGYYFGIAFSLAPIFIVLVVKFIDKPIWTFIILFISNYYISGISRYIPAVSPGIFMDGILILTVIVMIMQLIRKESEIKFKNAFNMLSFVAFIWFFYCCIQLLNPNLSSPVAWITNVRGIGVYFLLVTMITSTMLTKYSDLKKVMIAWAILSLTAVLKAVIQKYLGFDFAEARWLNEGGRTTHIIYSGVRYFSFFTDAANFGTGISFSMVVFTITGLYLNNKKLKIFFLATAVACGYGMFISGTRGSLAVPLVGFALITFISRNFKIIIVTSLVLLSAFIFLRYTYYLQGNSYVRRMRSAFNTEDASFIVRKENQKKLAVYLQDKPIGGGIGMGRSKATTYKPDPVLSSIPTDSWYVLIWMETGIVGLVMYVSILIFILISGIYIVMVKLTDHELKGMIGALVSGLAGVYVASYSLEIMGQFPNSFLIFISMALIFMSPRFEREIMEKKKAQSLIDETNS